MKKLLVVGIIILFVGMGFTSGKAFEYIQTEYDNEFVKSYRELSTCEHLVYFGKPTDDILHCSFYEGTLNDLGNATCICGGYGEIPPTITGSTWTNNARLFGCGYNSGMLREIDLETCVMTLIGGGGIGLNDLAYNPINEKLFGASSKDFYEIDIITGEQTHIGSFGIDNVSHMIAIAFDMDGICYGWDVKFSGESYLYEIDIDTGGATIVGGMGMTLLYAQTGDFCKVDDILYLAAHVSSPVNGNYFVECDEDTGECTILGKFPDSYPEITVFVIPWNFAPDIPSIEGPLSGRPGVEYDYTFNASDPNDDAIMYIIEWGDDNTEWSEYGDSGGEIILKHTWEASGNYTIKAQAIDIHGAESDWAEFTITMPRYKSTDNMLLLRIFERFPLLHRLYSVWRSFIL